MNFLIDYDNVRPIDKNRGLVHIVEKVVRVVGAAKLSSTSRVRARLYGGWLIRSQHSRLAQQLTAEIGANFPRVITVVDATVTARVTANVELAYSLECDPRNILPSTFRVRSAPDNLRPKATPYTGCQQPANCPLTVMQSFFANGSCTDSQCLVGIDAVIERAEQKLVDGMITTDLLHLSTRVQEPIAIVSSDDDLWPGIHGAVNYGASIFHIQTHSGRVTPPYYSSLVSGHYSQFSF